MFYTTTANITASGTSMACPVVSGVSALYLQANPAAIPAEVPLSSHAQTVHASGVPGLSAVHMDLVVNSTLLCN
jgi:subtilisin family serine protease